MLAASRVTDIKWYPVASRLKGKRLRRPSPPPTTSPRSAPLPSKISTKIEFEPLIAIDTINNLRDITFPRCVLDQQTIRVYFCEVSCAYSCELNDLHWHFIRCGSHWLLRPCEGQLETSRKSRFPSEPCEAMVAYQRPLHPAKACFQPNLRLLSAGPMQKLQQPTGDDTITIPENPVHPYSYRGLL
jgi:hypothetical protein